MIGTRCLNEHLALTRWHGGVMTRCDRCPLSWIECEAVKQYPAASSIRNTEISTGGLGDLMPGRLVRWFGCKVGERD